ncbi:MAG: hypothetical protein UR23_C0008G0002 [Candidatus Roizmanbacteria bacterium GW2011_GWA2_32_13]|uniref:Glycosyltransferase 2-like domain-containing protein n=1 Tax=Candidatus Roizmanbacteria bacterium GW2011_GWA2_32_13 TaxID=1618475 RepID=A0A0F9Z001_9BACT|nr:MAG: hypothetical protein UR23_C0008G0002 [Candidatus Roizmanbacteria bacterium GW2011_GWA2_32_13]
MLSPIVLFVYNRPEHTQKTVESLQKNFLAEESDLFIFSDGPKNDLDVVKVQEVRNYIKKISGFKSTAISEKDKNLGLANSIISGVTDIVNKFGKIIVLEDDMISSPYFLEFMNEALDIYGNEKKVISIHGYIYPIKNKLKEKLPETFFLKGADCWGWATWKRGWNLFEPDGGKLLRELEERNLLHEFDFNGSYPYSNMLRRQIAGQNDSWAIRWYASAFLRDKLTLYPRESLIQNIGLDNSGTHAGNSYLKETALVKEKIEISRIPAEENVTAKKILARYFKSAKPGLIKRIINKMSLK